MINFEQFIEQARAVELSLDEKAAMRAHIEAYMLEEGTEVSHILDLGAFKASLKRYLTPFSSFSYGIISSIWKSSRVRKS